MPARDSVVSLPVELNVQRIENVSLAAQRAPWDKALQLTIGYLSVFAWSRLIGDRGPSWTLFPFFLLVLLAVRVVPLVVRRLLPFSESVRAQWAERRALAKRFDSYQWQKLFWIGLGVALHVRSAERSGALLALMLICLASGGVGLAVWQRRAAQMERLSSQGTSTR